MTRTTGSAQVEAIDIGLTPNSHKQKHSQSETADPTGRRDQGLLHRRGRDPRPRRHSPRDRKGEYVSIAGPSGCGKSTLLSILGLLDSPTEGNYLLNGQPVGGPEAGRAGAHPQPRDRLHLPELQPHRRPHGLRERRAAADLPRHGGGRAQGARARGAGAGGHGAPRQAPAQPALRRSAAARRRGPRPGRGPVDPAGRRADRETSTRRTARR